MDIHLIPNAVPDDAERAAVDGVLGPPETGWDGATQRSPLEGHVGRAGQDTRDDRHLLLPALEAVQRRAGYISAGALNYVCQRLTVPPAEAYGVASFYALLYLKPTPPNVAHVCDDLACRINGALDLCREVEARLGPAGEPAADGASTWKRSPCLGLCELAPAALVLRAGENPAEEAIAPATADAVLAALSLPLEAPPSSLPVRPEALEGRPGQRGSLPVRPEALEGRTGTDAPNVRSGSRSAPQTQSEDRAALVLLRRVGRVDPTSLDEYRASGGYAALRRAFELGPGGVIRELLDSGLQGRGGAAFPTGRKWQEVAARAGTAALRGLQRRRIRARHLQGPPPHGGRPLRPDRGNHHRRLRRRLRARLHLRPRRVPPGRRAPRKRDRPGPRPRLPRRRHHGRRLRLRDRGQARRRRLHLRRGDRAVQLDRRAARRATQQAALSDPGRPLRQADAGQQRRDAGERARYRPRRRPGLRRHRLRPVPRAEAVLRLRPRRAPGRVRGALRDDAAAGAGPGRRRSAAAGR